MKLFPLHLPSVGSAELAGSVGALGTIKSEIFKIRVLFIVFLLFLSINGIGAFLGSPLIVFPGEIQHIFK